jgi:hypothetical protein
MHVNEIKTLLAESGGESRLQLPHTQHQYGAFSRLNGIIAKSNRLTNTLVGPTR